MSEKKQPKRGTLSNEEKLFITENFQRFSPEDIGEKLNRRGEVVRRFMMNAGLVPDERPKQPAAQTDIQTRLDLRHSERWKGLRHMYTSDELTMFEQEYVKLHQQFGGDVLPSEELQIMDFLGFEILKKRNMVGRKRAQEEVIRLEKELDVFYEANGKRRSAWDDEVAEEHAILTTELETSRRDEKGHTSEYVKLQERQDFISRALKSTRDQRVRDATSGQDTILGLFKRLQNAEVRDKVGREVELMKLAAESQYKRLGQLTEYEDGQWDRPILSADTVDMEDDAQA